MDGKRGDTEMLRNEHMDRWEDIRRRLIAYYVLLALSALALILLVLRSFGVIAGGAPGVLQYLVAALLLVYGVSAVRRDRQALKEQEKKRPKKKK